MSFASLWLHGIWKLGYDESLDAQSPSPLSKLPTDAKLPELSISSAEYLALKASIDSFAEALSQMNTTLESLAHQQQQQVIYTTPQPQGLTEEGALAMWSLFPSFLWAIAFAVFMDGANKISKSFMLNTMLSAFGCANLGLASLVFGLWGTELRWFSYLVGILWSMQGAMVVSLIVGKAGSVGGQNAPVEVQTIGEQKKE
jgi:hypothetical protein